MNSKDSKALPGDGEGWGGHGGVEVLSQMPIGMLCWAGPD